MPLNGRPATRETQLRMRGRLHDTCLLCGDKNPVGLKLDFAVAEDGGVSVTFMCHFRFEGYKGCLHGGMAAALLDSAMSNCLFAHGIAAFTAEMTIKYKKPVRCGRKALVTAHIEKDLAPLYIVKGEISQEGQTLVLAEAKFMESDSLNPAP